jgi:hypothetical protein
MNAFKKFIKYPDRISAAAKSLDASQQHRLATLKKDGCLVIPDSISAERLILMQKIYRNELENNCRFETPCLGQALINEQEHEDLIRKHFLCSKKELEKRQLTFNLDEELAYSDVIARYNPSTVTVSVSQIQELFTDWLHEDVLELVEAYMGVRPYLAEAYIRRNFPARYKVMNHFWHRDDNQPDYVLKAFIFLSDCEIDNGPHEFILGSVKSDHFPGGNYFMDEEIDAVFPPNGEHRLVSVVKAGTLILEDTTGLHRALMPENGFRDLGYAVFVPRPFYSRQQQPLYSIQDAVFNRLSSYQKQFVPAVNINYSNKNRQARIMSF